MFESLFSTVAGRQALAFLLKLSGRYICSENVQKILRKAFANQGNFCIFTGFSVAPLQKLHSVIDAPAIFSEHFPDSRFSKQF